MIKLSRNAIFVVILFQFFAIAKKLVSAAKKIRTLIEFLQIFIPTTRVTRPDIYEIKERKFFHKFIKLSLKVVFTLQIGVPESRFPRLLVCSKRPVAPACRDSGNDFGRFSVTFLEGQITYIRAMCNFCVD